MAADPVTERLSCYTASQRAALEALAGLVREVAHAHDVGKVEECLKWGQISFLTPETRAGTTVRIDAEGDIAALYVNCQTSLVDEWRDRFPQVTFSGNRGAHFPLGSLPMDALRQMIGDALIYHRRKHRRS